MRSSAGIYLLMKSLPYLVFVLLIGGFAAYVWQTQHQLPIRTATHFNWEGHADGWSSRDAQIRTTLLAGIGVPLLIVGVFASIRFMPTSLINLPNKEQWLSPEHRNETIGWISRSGVWLAGALIIFMASIHYFTLQANAVKPPKLDSRSLMIAAGILTAFELGFIVRMVLRFAKPPALPAK